MNQTNSKTEDKVSSSKNVKSSEEQEILDYWTKGRMDKAEPLPFPTLSQSQNEKIVEKEKNINPKEEPFLTCDE